METTIQYRLSKEQKSHIAQNLIDILQKDAVISKHTRTFVGNWILSGPDKKSKAFFDVWDIVLKNYLPTKRPILFRASNRISRKAKIASFTGRLECARRFSKGRGYLIICDTNESLAFEEKLSNAGEYKNTFYPLVSVLIKARDSGGCGFSERLLNDYIGEDEYIMRVNLGRMYRFRWMNNDL